MGNTKLLLEWVNATLCCNHPLRLWEGDPSPGLRHNESGGDFGSYVATIHLGR